jgi:hypothetical protein
MILIESYPECKTSEELRKYERFHYDIIRPELNVYRPYTTEEENKGNISKRQKSIVKIIEIRLSNRTRIYRYILYK